MHKALHIVCTPHELNLRYTAIAGLTFGDLFGPILCTQNPISSIISLKLEKYLNAYGTKLKLFL